MTACERCHARKTRCDKQTPECGTCLKSGVRCQYPEDKLQYRRTQRMQLMSMEERLRSLERENAQLRSGHKAAHSPGATTDSLGTAHSNGKSQSDRVRPGFTENPEFRSNTTFSATTAIPPMDSSHRSAEQTTPARPASQARYLGSSAGADFIDLVESVVDDSPASAGEMFARVSEAYCRPHVATRTAPPSQAVPEQATARQLIASYFDHWHVTFPLLYRPSFMQLVDRIYSEPDLCSRNRETAFVFNIVLALGSAASNRFEWCLKDTESYFTRAMENYDEILRFRDIRTLQALLLCCQYGIHASLRDTADEMWDLLGKAERICVEIGLHQSRSFARRGRSDFHLTGPLPVPAKAEMLRRCFWCFYSLDRIVSVTLGRTLTISDDDIDTPLPSPLDDDELEHQCEDSEIPTDGPGRQASPFLRLISIRRILAKIHRGCHTSVPTRCLTGPEKLAIRQKLLLELEEWKQQNVNVVPPPKDDSSLVLSAFQCHSWWEAIYYNAVLLIFRPPAISVHSDQQGVLDDEDVLKSMWESSRKLISNYKEILQARRLNYSWICLYTIFMAGLSNVYSVGRSAHRQKRDPNSFLPACADVVADIKDCSNILTAICERWDDARKSCEIFSRLSDSAFKELLKAHLSKAQKWKPTSETISASQPNMERAAYDTAPANSSPFPVFLPDGRHVAGSDLQFAVQGSIDQQGSVLDDVEGFQDVFLNMQSTLNCDSYDSSNEVMMGLSRNWFEQWE